MTQRDRDAPGPARLVLHCGAFKTGSSRIQSHAYDARGELRDLGWLYPETGLDVAELTVDPVAQVGSRWRLGGCLLPAGPVPPGVRVLAVNDAGEREVAAGLPSAAFARRHPGRPEAATARFRVARIHPGTSGRIELVLEHPSGRRSVLATFRRRWVPHPAA